MTPHGDTVLTGVTSDRLTGGKILTVTTLVYIKTAVICDKTSPCSGTIFDSVALVS